LFALRTRGVFESDIVVQSFYDVVGETADVCRWDVGASGDF
jgi:succinate dehydrogenase flavin-adding protein (antitoxin of CptAB toxin-antitoxin module)